MTVTLNGKPYETSDGIKLESLLGDLGLSGKPAIVEINKIAILPSAFSETVLNADDKIEIVALAAGG